MPVEPNHTSRRAGMIVVAFLILVALIAAFGFLDADLFDVVSSWAGGKK
jgi:hypothetical protein